MCNHVWILFRLLFDDKQNLIKYYYCKKCNVQGKKEIKK